MGSQEAWNLAMASIANIEIFSRITEDQIPAVEALFSTRTYGKGANILTEGVPVDGLYLMQDGEVEVIITGYTGSLTKLGAGTSFGEMSLYNDNDVASATIRVSSDSADVLFCSREDLASLLNENRTVSEGFYYGSALMLAARLRTTNEKIGGEIANSIRMATELVEDIASQEKLGHAQSEVQDAGSNIIYGMTGVLKTLMTMKQSGDSIPPDEISDLADTAKDLYYSEFQIFDKIHQQLQLIGQHLQNVRRILNQEEIESVEGDTSLLGESDK